VISVRVVRSTTLAICAAGIAAMIVASALDHNGAAITFGLITAVAIVCSMVAKAVAADTEHRLGQSGGADQADSAPVDSHAELVERQVQGLVAGGADEGAVRQLVGEAVRLGRTLRRSGP
jgi:hypothetical protein